MTGHGEAHGQSDRLHLTAEVRSVNNRYFKLMLRAPEPYNLLETEVEKLVRRFVRRGTLQVHLRVDRPQREQDYRINAIALRSMEKAGLIRRARMSEDKRVARVWLTAKAKRMREELLLVARGINEDACRGVTREELDAFRRAITRMTGNLDRVMR